MNSKFTVWAEEDLRLFAHTIRCGTINRVSVGSDESNAPKPVGESTAWELDTRRDAQVVAYHRVSKALEQLGMRHGHTRGIVDLVCHVCYDQKPVQEFLVAGPFSIRKRTLKEHGTHFEAAGLLRDLKDLVAKLIQEEQEAADVRQEESA